MTSPKFNARKAEAEVEMQVYDMLPEALRKAIDNADGSVRASVVANALLRGVSEETIIQTLKRSSKS